MYISLCINSDYSKASAYPISQHQFTRLDKEDIWTDVDLDEKLERNMKYIRRIREHCATVKLLLI